MVVKSQASSRLTRCHYVMNGLQLSLRINGREKSLMFVVVPSTFLFVRIVTVVALTIRLRTGQTVCLYVWDISRHIISVFIVVFTLLLLHFVGIVYYVRSKFPVMKAKYNLTGVHVSIHKKTMKTLKKIV